MNALATEQNALSKIMRESMPQDIGTPDLGKSLDIVNRGYIGGLLGGFPDTANLLLNTFVPGYDVEVPVGGSEWWGQKMQGAGMVSDRRYPAEELLAGLVNPIPAGIFAGKGAKMADMAKLLMAEGMLAKGDDAADVWRATGWGKGPDEKWRFEIPDDTARFRESAEMFNDTMRRLQKRGIEFDEAFGLAESANKNRFSGEAIDHSVLYGNYPEAAAIPVEYAGTGGAYGDSAIRLGNDSKDTMLHELQHAIQEREGFARGGSPESIKDPSEFWVEQGYDKRLKELESKPDNALTPKEKQELVQLWIERDRLLPLIDEFEYMGGRYGAYKRLAGEAESRLTQARMNLTPEERLLSYPWDADYFERMTGVPIDRLIYRDVSPDVAEHRVYHGSPHLFDKFDASKIGTGEGAQAYGHGLYFAESPEVAKVYQEGLASGGYTSGTGRKLDGNEAWAAQFLHDFSGKTLPPVRDSLENAIEKINRTLNPSKQRDSILEFARLLDKEGVSYDNGNLYTVDIPDEWLPRMLDWDKPLSEQGEVLRNIASDYGVDSDYKARQLYNKLSSAMAKPPFDNTKTGYGAQAQAEASEYLRELGIPGIRYLDGSSRGNGQGTYNYVIFPGMEDQIKMLERNGIPIEDLLK